jgi:hypothetical protein
MRSQAKAGSRRISVAQHFDTVSNMYAGLPHVHALQRPCIVYHTLLIGFVLVYAVGLSGHRIPDAAAGGTFFAATKFAVKALTEGLRQEVRCNGWLAR